MIWLLLIGLLLLAVGAVLLDVTVLRRHGSWTPSWRIPGYSVLPNHWLPALLGSAAVTIGTRVLIRWGVTPSAFGLAHEYCHTLRTSWVRYAWSRLTGGTYHLEEELAANEYAGAHHHLFEADSESLAWYLHREVIVPRQVKP
jgi:hypothetical protein